MKKSLNTPSTYEYCEKRLTADDINSFFDEMSKLLNVTPINKYVPYTVVDFNKILQDCEVIVKAILNKCNLPKDMSVLEFMDLVKEKTPEWQPIETAPEGREVLVFIGLERLVAWKDKGKWRNSNGENLCEDENNTPTHWAPLPNPPKGEK